MDVSKASFSLVISFIFFLLSACTIPRVEKYTYKAVNETDPKIVTETLFSRGYLKLSINQNYDNSNNNCIDYKVTKTITGFPKANVIRTLSLEPDKPTSIMITYLISYDKSDTYSIPFFGHYFFTPKKNEKYIFRFKVDDKGRKTTGSLEVENNSESTEKIVKFDHGYYFWKACKGFVLDDTFL